MPCSSSPLVGSVGRAGRLQEDIAPGGLVRGRRCMHVYGQADSFHRHRDSDLVVAEGLHVWQDLVR